MHLGPGLEDATIVGDDEEMRTPKLKGGACCSQTIP